MRRKQSKVTIENQNKTRVRKFKITTTLSFLLFNFSFFISNSALAEGIRLGVVRSADNATQWTGITSRLNESGVRYCIVDLEKVRNGTDLSGPTVLFFPNVESLTLEQAQALEAWMNKGGRVIVSGPVGNLSPPGVRQKLRSLFGAYWAFPLSAPEALQPMRTRTQEWVNSQLAGTVHGGVVIPTGLNSQTAATWTVSDSPPAVVTTNRTTFFGWRWGLGTAASSQVDLGWLVAALNRYGNIAQAGTVPASTGGNCVAPGSSPIAARQTREAGRNSPSSVSNNQSSVSNNQSSVSNNQSSVSNNQSTAPVDPTERVATAAIRVNPNAEIISSSDAIAMRQELENLIGRVESALLAVNAIDNKNLVAEEAGKKETLPLNSAPTNVASSASISTQNTAFSTIQKAREILQTFPDLVAKRDYSNAKNQWLQARQSLWNIYPITQQIQQPEIRAIWLDRGSIISAGSEQGLAKIFDKLAQSGINTVFFETVNAGYTIYPSQVAPEQNPLTKGWDPLAAAVKLAHERGMELHAWVWVFATGNQRHNAILNQPQDYPGPVISANPSWANYDRQGNMIPAGQTKPFLDPANPEVRRYLLNLFNEIVSRYNVDGLQLDYIRYPFQDPSRGATYGYGAAARQQFQAMTGTDPIKITPNNRQLWQKWTDFRTNQVNSFVAEVSQLLRQTRPNLILSAAVFGYPEAERIQKLQQNWEVWTRRGDIDLIMPMAYAQDTNRFGQLAGPWLSNPDLGATLVLPGILLLNLPEIGAIDQIQFIRDLPNGGYSLFAFEHLTNQLQSIFNRTQGIVQPIAKQPIPYRQPFAAAAANYAVLQREWNFLRQTNQLRLPDSAGNSFTSESEALNQALNQLSQQPNASNLVVARNSLREFRFKFRNWMSLHSMENNYQVQTWNNRLDSLEKLLNYGERVVLNRQGASATQR